MTSERDFDRIARAWLDLGPTEAPDRAVAAVIAATRTTPQVRRSFRWLPWRPRTMTRITMLAVLAGTIAIVVGGLVLTVGTQPEPAPTIAPATDGSSQDPSATPVASPGTLPAEFFGGWVAPSRGTAIENLTAGSESALGGNLTATTIVLAGTGSADFTPGPAFWLDRRGTPLLQSRITEESPGVVRFEMATSADPNCVGRDSGTYSWSQTADGQWLTLELIEDACEIRGEILPGMWQRSLAHDSQGGPGISAVFEPFVTLTLPAEPWFGAGLGEVDALAMDNEPGTADIRIWKDVDGFVDPCDAEPGRLDLAPGIDPFLDYLRSEDRFTVLREDEVTVDGRRAVEVEIRLGLGLEMPCFPMDGNQSDRSGILLWAPHAADGAVWNGAFGDQWSLVVTEVDGSTFVMELVQQVGDTWPVDREVLDTVRFLDTLPEPPTP